jgi:hypothetical protein
LSSGGRVVKVQTDHQSVARKGNINFERKRSPQKKRKKVLPTFWAQSNKIDLPKKGERIKRTLKAYVCMKYCIQV